MELDKNKINGLLKCIDFENNIHKFDFMEEKSRTPRETDIEGGDAVTYVCSVCGATKTYFEVDSRSRGTISELKFPDTYYFLKDLIKN